MSEESNNKPPVEEGGTSAGGLNPMLKALLALLALLVLALAIWFLGPYVAIGEMRPLADVGVRVVLIGLVLAALLSWLLDWSARVTWSVLGAAALSLLLWHGGPLLALGSVRPLAPEWARVLVVGLLWLTLVVWGLYKFYRALQADEQLVQKWLQPSKAEPALAKEEIRALAATARQKVAQLRQMHLTVAGGTGRVWLGLRRLVEGKRYLYELPWYVLIGQPGAGKSSAVLGSGLRFALGEQMGEAGVRLTTGKHVGTAHCDWWLTNEAVLLDTAGRYTDAADSQRADDLRRKTNEAEWRGFLGVLRQVRPRAPINGAVLVVDTVQLLSDSAEQRLALAGQLRSRLHELRLHLGIRFPVYLVLAKADVLRGFDAYFGSLTAEARAQVWGYTLPWAEEVSALQRLSGKAQASEAPDWMAQIDQGLQALVQRVRDGLGNRLQEEFEVDRRQALYVLPHELDALSAPLLALVEAVFAPSRYDTTQTQSMLRGVYLSSAMQTGQEVTAPSHALLARLQKGFAELSKQPDLLRRVPASTGRRSYFLSDLWQRLVFAEAHLVQPNLKWEARMRLLRWIGHGLVLLAFVWLSGALTLSYHNNRAYLHEVTDKTGALTDQMKRWLSDPSAAQSERVLAQAQALPLHAGLNLSDPAMSYRYGLYSADSVASVARQGYGELLDRLVLPVVLAHMEQVMRKAVVDGDAQLAYNSLRAYLLLHDSGKFAESPDNVREVRNWVLQQWQEGGDDEEGLSQKLGASAAMVGHLEWLFSGQRLTQSAKSRNEGLVREVRAFLDKQSSSERLYERAKSALWSDQPQEFSLVRALGPQAGTLFSRASGKSLEKGVPGLFTYDGYHELFAKRLPQTLAQAEQDDQWVMGKAMAMDAAQKKNESNQNERRELMEDLRRQFLIEYAQQWQVFLADIRLVRSDKSGTLAFDLNILRQLAAADSPLIRLARLAARETTLSRALQSEAANEKSIFDKAGEQLAEQKQKAAIGLGVRPEQKAERQWVDDKFGALREVVTGQSEGAGAVAASKAGLDTMTNALSEYYTVLVVADSALGAGSLPPPGTEAAATKLRIEAGKLPVPLRDVLMDVGSSGADKVTQGAANILKVQAQAQMDRLTGLLALTVSEPCQRQIAGRYPFAASAQEVSADDFNAFFAEGGAADEYFRKHLAPLVDTSVRPWRYKSATSAMLSAGSDGGNQAQAQGTGPTLTGELLKLLAQAGPNPDAFAQIGQIRDMFFREAGAKRMAWRGEYKVVSLDATVTEWVIDIDGQVQRYAHGAVQAMPIQWPGPRGGTMAELQVHPRIKAETSGMSVRGPWGWMRLIERGKLSAGTQSGRQMVEFVFDNNRRAVLEITSGGPSPFDSALLRGFVCPGRAA